MKKILLSIIALCCTMAVSAQGTDEISAVLQHGEEVSVYKGSTGLQQAYAAASDGDVITLSKGTFYAVNIEKSLTIYGAGFEVGEETKTDITTINATLNVGKADDVIEGFHIHKIGILAEIFQRCCLRISPRYSCIADTLPFLLQLLREKIPGNVEGRNLRILLL